MAKAVSALLAGEVTRIILTRPAVEAGESLGFLPGSLNEKIDPYLRPLYDALHEMIDPVTLPKLMDAGTIEVAPLAYMRGRTLNDAFIILDEAQNTTSEQMKMFLTRLGFGSHMVVTGDTSQVDLPRGTDSGLAQAVEVLRGGDDVGRVGVHLGGDAADVEAGAAEGAPLEDRDVLVGQLGGDERVARARADDDQVEVTVSHAPEPRRAA